MYNVAYGPQVAYVVIIVIKNMEIYHVLNRGVDKRKIFIDRQDYFRFMHNLWIFNDQEWIYSSSRIFRRAEEIHDIASRVLRRKPRKLLVDIHAFCLMPNHYHLLLSPRIENGIPKFMRKVNMGYAKYFNIKYKRSGALFEGRYRGILVNNENYFLHLPFYIHLNPLDLISPEWRNGKIKNYKEAIKFLEKYRWSSLPDYIGIKNFPSVISQDFVLECFGGKNEYKSKMYEWLKDMNLANINNMTLE